MGVVTQLRTITSLPCGLPIRHKPPGIQHNRKLKEEDPGSGESRPPMSLESCTRARRTGQSTRRTSKSSWSSTHASLSLINPRLAQAWNAFLPRYIAQLISSGWWPFRCLQLTQYHMWKTSIVSHDASEADGTSHPGTSSTEHNCGCGQASATLMRRLRT